MVIDWGKQIDECLKNNRLMPIFHENVVSRTLEKVLVVKRLRELGWSDRKIFNWFRLAECEDVYDESDVARLGEIAKRRRWPKKHLFRVWITMDEIRKIDSLKTTKENKSYLLAAVAFAKMMLIKRKKPTFNLNERSYVYYISSGSDDYRNGKRRGKYIDRFMSGLFRRRFVRTESAKTSVRVYFGGKGARNKRVYNVILQGDWIEWDAKDGYPINTLETDVKKLCDLAFQERTEVCPECGREYVVTPMTKRAMCLECCEKARREKWRPKDERKNHGCAGTHDHGGRSPKAMKEIVCENCGKAFMVSSKGKRRLCDECYAEDLKKRNLQCKKKSL